MNRSGALIGASLGLLGTLTFLATNFPRPIGSAWLAATLAVVIGGLLGGFARPRRIAWVCTVIAVDRRDPRLHARDARSGALVIRRDSIPAERLDAVVVLSSGVSDDSLLDPAAVERLLTGLAVFRDNGARLLVTTRNGVSRSDRRIESDVDRRRLIDLAADTGALARRRSRAHDARRSRPDRGVLLPLEQRRVAVVTSPLHTRRACRTFEKVGFRVTCVPSDERLYSVSAPSILDDAPARHGGLALRGAGDGRSIGWRVG